VVLAVALIGVLASSAAAQAAAGKVTIHKSGEYKSLNYKGTDDINVVTLGGSLAERTLTITEIGIADPSAVEDPDNDCSLAGSTLTCTADAFANPSTNAYADMYAGNDVVTIDGTRRWSIYGSQGDDSLTGGPDDDMLAGEDGNDTLDGRGDSGRFDNGDAISGGLGNDTLRGGPGTDYLNGGPGDDDLDSGEGYGSLYGEEGVDFLRGGSGDDYLNTGPGAGEFADGGAGSDEFGCEGDAGEIYDGGPGFDAVECYQGLLGGGVFDPHDFAIDLTAGTVKRTNHDQTTSVLSSIEDAEAGEGDDILIGTDGPNRLESGAGNDRIEGRGGADHLRGGEGQDTLESIDGKSDRVDGGPGADTGNADEIDETFGLETLMLAPVEQPASPAVEQPTGGPAVGQADVVAPGFTIRAARAVLSRGRITFSVTTNESASLTADAVGRLSRLSRGALASRAGDVTLATTKARAEAGKTVRLTVKVPRRYRQALVKRSRIRVVVTAMDAAGNKRTAAKAVRL
jgi:Ca2+-binding RTX toxin-like protein